MQNVATDLSNGHIVVFSGTPCQVFAMKNYIEKKQINAQNLYLIDLICHGVGEKKVWNDFKEWLEKRHDSKLTNFRFRYPYSKWRINPVLAEFDNGKKYVNTFDIRRYMKLYQSDLIMNRRCYSCPFCSTERISDITLGDFWSVDKLLPDFSSYNGVSQVLINTEKGKELFTAAAKSNINVHTKIINEPKKALQKSLVACVEKPSNYEQFWRDYSSRGIEYVLREYAEFSIMGFIKHVIGKARAELF